MSEPKQRADQVSGGVFLIGLALLFMTGFWWPGIMFVIGASIIGRTMAEGKPISSAVSAFWVIGIGLIFWLPGFVGLSIGSLWPLVLIAIGLSMLFGGQYRSNMMQSANERGRRKSKNDEMASESWTQDDYELESDADAMWRTQQQFQSRDYDDERDEHQSYR